MDLKQSASTQAGLTIALNLVCYKFSSSLRLTARLESPNFIKNMAFVVALPRSWADVLTFGDGRIAENLGRRARSAF